MSQRLVTQKDLNKHPELASKGVSVNQFYDFDAEYDDEQDEEEDDDWQAPRPTPKKAEKEKDAPAKSAPAVHSSNKKSK